MPSSPRWGGELHPRPRTRRNFLQLDLPGLRNVFEAALRAALGPEPAARQSNHNPAQESITAFSPGQELRSLLKCFCEPAWPRRAPWSNLTPSPPEPFSALTLEGDAQSRHLELTDLHLHVGGAVAPHILWAIAHDHGFKLPVKTYWDSGAGLRRSVEGRRRWTTTSRSCTNGRRRFSRRPPAIERSVYEVIGKEYRSIGVSMIELRFNPMKRNLGGERDLDHIIAAALRGMDRACLDYGVRAGLIFCLAREFETR